ncbi:MAG TPA: PSD1 and planctomycete cytochrome C domain-containing protein [Acidobacteriaceae bacterium]|nr:PSD1 and planctomycete cytochrome C domain-containing protein [Acidobacteriaceae bacterium]
MGPVNSSLFRSRSFKITSGLAVILAGVALTALPHLRPASSGDRVDFSRDIQPIFNQNCVSCHGGVRQKNGVSFIFRAEALGKGDSGKPTIVPGDPDASELMVRVTSKDPESRMPYHAPMLRPEQIELLRRWIKQGAQWEDYWAFVPPKPQSLPAVKGGSWVRQPLDRFILARLEKESLDPSPEADKAELLRRVSFDLTGLPPTPQEMQAYLSDRSPNAYEKQVDRLLASPGYGERWASMWLDLARYADTQGYEKDRTRPGVWPYRDWVIDAFNHNMPYDQFVIAQLAGDLLPNKTFGDEIATSFHRQTPNNTEGGTDDEEFRMLAVMDRVSTTWSVLNGITMNCVQCHSHPYDPIRHADYYKSMAFFNTQNDADLDNDSPNLLVPKDKAFYPEAFRIQQEKADLLRSVVNSGRGMTNAAKWQLLPIQSAVADETPVLGSEIPHLEEKVAELEKKPMNAQEKADELRRLRTDIALNRKNLARAKTEGPAKTFDIVHGEALANAHTPPLSFYELTGVATLPAVTAIRVEVPPRHPEQAIHTPEDAFIVDEVRAFVVQPNGHKDRIVFRSFLQDSEGNLAAQTARDIGAKKAAKGDNAAADGFAAERKLFRTRWIVGILAAPLQLRPQSRIEVDLKQTQGIDSKPALVQSVRLSVSEDPKWTAYGLDPARARKIARLQELDRELAKIPTVPLPVMTEQEPYERRATREFERGNFLDKIGPNLEPDVPAIFPKLPAGAPRNRLTLARWFFAPSQPLTARVAVNRYWEELFGTGIVETLENFGSVGEAPSHPELLDWLALHFQYDLHWDMKALLREMVTSATYRQSAVTTPALLARDPRNRLLAHGPQQRLTAEMVRDQALADSGLLNRTMGGPPVMPPQPAGVWNSVYNSDQWKDAVGPDRYRRAIYTFIKRTSGYPSFLTFDASDRDTSLPRRISTNTPLQALVTLNDPVYQEAAAALALRVVKECGAKNTDALLTYETRLVLSRDPSPRELQIMRGYYERSLVSSTQPSTVRVSLVVPKETSQRNISPQQELAGLKAAGNLLFNLDSALTR